MKDELDLIDNPEIRTKRTKNLKLAVDFSMLCGLILLFLLFLSYLRAKLSSENSLLPTYTIDYMFEIPAIRGFTLCGGLIITMTLKFFKRYLFAFIFSLIAFVLYFISPSLVFLIH